MKNSGMLKEAHIKAALIDHFIKKGLLENAVLINEMVIANWMRRADLVVANGHLQAFEIKSQFDSLRRFSGQLEEYLQRFDKLTLVVSPKFVTNILNMTPKHVEVWEVDNNKNENINFKVVRKGCLLDIKNKNVLCDFLLKEELVNFLKKNKEETSIKLSRRELVEKIEGMPSSKLRQFVLESFKERYKFTFEKFMEAHKEKTDICDLNKLSKKKLNSSLLTSKSSKFSSPLQERHKKLLTFSKLFPDGDVPPSIPRYIFLPTR